MVWCDKLWCDSNTILGFSALAEKIFFVRSWFVPIESWHSEVSTSVKKRAPTDTQIPNHVDWIIFFIEKSHFLSVLDGWERFGWSITPMNEIARQKMLQILRPNFNRPYLGQYCSHCDEIISDRKLSFRAFGRILFYDRTSYIDGDVVDSSWAAILFILKNH